jgi:hypothetical protein
MVIKTEKYDKYRLMNIDGGNPGKFVFDNLPRGIPITSIHISSECNAFVDLTLLPDGIKLSCENVGIINRDIQGVEANNCVFYRTYSSPHYCSKAGELWKFVDIDKIDEENNTLSLQVNRTALAAMETTKQELTELLGKANKDAEELLSSFSVDITNMRDTLVKNVEKLMAEKKNIKIELEKTDSSIKSLDRKVYLGSVYRRRDTHNLPNAVFNFNKYDQQTYRQVVNKSRDLFREFVEKSEREFYKTSGEYKLLSVKEIKNKLRHNFDTALELKMFDSCELDADLLCNYGSLK